MLTITTDIDEIFDSLDEAGETADGDGLSVREAIGLITSGTSTGPIVFASGLGGSFISIDSRITVTTDLVFNAFDSGSTTSDVALFAGTGDGLFDLAGDNISVEFNNLELVADASGSTSDLYKALIVSGDGVTMTSADFYSEGYDGSFGDRSSAIQVLGDNFTLNNTGTILTTGRWAIEADATTDHTMTINNDGVLQATDDAIRLNSGTINNSGTIRTTGEFDFGGFNETGFVSDAISVLGNYYTDSVFTPGGIVTINNESSGVIEGYRTGILSSGGGTINNHGLITGEAVGVFTQSFLSNAEGFPIDKDISFALTNTGTIARLSDIQSGYGSDSLGAVFIVRIGTSDFESVTITNSGAINSVDTAVRVEGGLTLDNLSGGVLQSDTDMTGDDGVAYRASTLADYHVDVGVSFFNAFTPAGQTASTQNADFDGAGNLVIDGVGVFTLADYPSIAMLYLTFVTADFVLPLVDLDATIASDRVVFVEDPVTGLLDYPETIVLNTAEYGDLTVTFDNTTREASVVDANGKPVYNVPAGFEFTDVITNAGDIFGDVVTGIGDDSVTNSGAIYGDVDLGVGNDMFAGGSADESVFGGNGHDDLSGGDGGDELDGGNGHDVLSGDNGNDTVSGGNGNDEISGGNGIDILYGGNGNDRIEGGGNGDTINGGAGDDELIGFAGSDMIDGGDGNDIINGGHNNDTIFGGDGDDVIIGGNSSDTISGDAGNDHLSGNFGADTMHGGLGDDTLIGGGNGDFLYGDDGNDRIVGGRGHDTLSGGTGSDNINGGHENDTLFGDNGSDLLKGDGGDDILDGGNGVDTLNGGAGADTLTGGNRLDTFVFNEGDSLLTGRDLITDLEAGETIALDVHTFLGAGAFTASGQFEVRYISGVTTVLELDYDGDGTADEAIDITGEFGFTSDGESLTAMVMSPDEPDFFA